MTQQVFTRNGMVVLGPGGLAQLLPDTAAPNAVDLSEQVTILTDGDSRVVTLILPDADYSSYSSVTLVWRAVDADGVDVASTWSVPPVSGSTILGFADKSNGDQPPVLGACVNTDPRYELCITDTSGRMGYSRGLQTVDFDTFIDLDVTTDPGLDTPTEGQPLTGAEPVYTGEVGVTYSWVYQMAEDVAGTGADDIADTLGLCPEIDAPNDCVRRGAVFAGDGTDGLEGPYWSPWRAITAATVETPVSQSRAALIASIKINVDGMTGSLPVAGGLIASGTASAQIVAYVAGAVANTGTIYTGPVANTTIADNAAITWAGGAGLANGAQAAWAMTAGEPFYILDPVYDGDVTGNILRQEIATDNAGTGAVLAELSGAFPPHFGTKYYRYTRRVSGYGIATPPGYQDFSTAWTLIGVPTLTKLADTDWPRIISTEVAGGSRLDEVYLKQSLVVTELRWTTSSDTQIAGNPYPAGHEPMTLAGTISSVATLNIDGHTGDAPTGTVTAGAVTGTVLGYGAGTASGEGTIYFSALSGAIADNTALTWTGGSALANGARVVETVVFERWAAADANYGTPVKNYRIFGVGDETRRTRLALVATIGGARTPLSNRKTVPSGVEVAWPDGQRFVFRSEGQAEIGEPGGTGMQFPRAWDVEANYVHMGYDVTFGSESFDFGDNWSSEPGVGLTASHTYSGVVVDGNYVNVMVGALFMKSQGNHNAKAGIYRKNRTTGVWTFTLAIPDMYGSNTGAMRRNQKYMTKVAGSGSGPDTRTLFAIVAPSLAADGFTTIQIKKSTNGGATWANDGATINTSTVGRPLGLHADTTALYLWTLTGLWRRPFAGGSWTQATGLAAGAICNVEKRGTTVYAVPQNAGLYTATDTGAATLAFTLRKALSNAGWVAVCPTDPNRILLTGRSSSPAGIGTWDGPGAAANQWFTISSQPYVGQPGDFQHKLVGDPHWLRWHDTDPNVVLAMRYQHMGKSTDGGRTFVWSARNNDYSEVRALATDPTDYRKLFLGMTDRLCLAAEHGAAFVQDDGISDALKNSIRAATGAGEALTARGALILKRGDITGRLVMIGDNIEPKVPVISTRTVTTTRTPTATTGNGTVTATASSALPGGTYRATCTVAGATGTFAITGPLGLDMGNVTVGGGATIKTHPRGGTITYTIADGSTNFTAGSDPCVITTVVNPVGSQAIISPIPSTLTIGFYGQQNPATSYRGGSGRYIFEMDVSGNITILRTLAQNFQGYMGTGGSIILCSNNSTTLYRSTDEGATGLGTVWASPGNFAPRGIPVVWPSHHNDQRAFVGSNNGRMRKIQNGVATTIFDLDAWLTEQGITTDLAGSAQVNGRWVPMVSGVVESFYDPDLLYVSTYVFGGPYNFFRTTNGTDAAPTWENLTESLGFSGWIQSITIHPITDEVLIETSHGTMFYKPDAAHLAAFGITSSIIDDLRSLPGSNYWQTAII